MNKKGYTLIELLLSFSLIMLIVGLVYQMFTKEIDSSKESAYNRQIKTIISIAKDYHLQNPNTTYVMIDDLKKNGLIEDAIDPRDGSIIEGCVKFNLDSYYNQYKYEYLNLTKEECRGNFVDTIAPNISVVTISSNLKEAIVKIIVSDNEDGELSSENKYQYYISTSNTELIGGNWTDYESGEVLTISGNRDYYLWVYPIKDNAGNISNNKNNINTPFVIKTFHFDSEKPVLVVEPSSGNYETSASITITASDNNELDEGNVYKYYLSTSLNNRENGEWTSYTSGETFTITGTNETKYLWVWPIKDSVGNVSGDNENVNTPYVAGVYKFVSTYTITYNLNGGTLSGTNPSTYTYENTFTLKNPTKAGYTFTGWTGSNGSAPSTSVTVEKGSTGDKAYTANFTPAAYTITYNLNGGSANNKTTYTIETSSFTLTNPTKTGYTFTGWTGSNGTTASTSVTISKGSTGNKTYTANFTPITYTITYNLNGGSVSNRTTYTIETATFTLANPTKSGMLFAGWTGSNGSTPSTSITISKGSTGNKTYTANFAATSYTFSYTGSAQTFKAPVTGNYQIELKGASGGDGQRGLCSGGYGGSGGKGGYVKATVKLTAGTSYTVWVGGSGHSGDDASGGDSKGGLPNGTAGVARKTVGGGGGGGGGATYISLSSTVYLSAYGGGGGGGGADGGWYKHKDGSTTCGGCDYRNVGSGGEKGGAGGGNGSVSGGAGGSGASKDCEDTGYDGGAGSYYINTTYSTKISGTNGSNSGNGSATIKYVS